MWSQRNLLVWVVGVVAVSAAAAQANGSLRWRSGVGPLGLQPAASAGWHPCGPASFTCDNATSVPLYTSRRAPRSLSMQLDYGSGTPPALKLANPPGLSLSLVGRAGLLPDLGVYGRVGTTFGQQPTTAAASVDGGVNYGVGLSWSLTRSASAVLGWDSYDVRGATGDSRDVRATSLGLQWRY